jgi:hypothetical protein
MLIAGAALALLTVAAQPAFAKFENATITIDGPGLAAPIELSGAGALLWERYSGIFEQKWPVPNVDGGLAPDAHLGPAYGVAIRFDCGDQTTEAFAETLYPYARGGPQIFTGPGVRFCGMTASSGYFPASIRLLHALVSQGLPKTEPATGGLDGGSPTDGGIGSTTVALVGGLAVLAAAAFALRRRRTRAAA